MASKMGLGHIIMQTETSITESGKMISVMVREEFIGEGRKKMA